jgi:hypothetical protein
MRGTRFFHVEEPEEKKQCTLYVLEANLALQNGMVIPLLSEILSTGKKDGNVCPL